MTIPQENVQFMEAAKNGPELILTFRWKPVSLMESPTRQMPRFTNVEEY